MCKSTFFLIFSKIGLKSIGLEGPLEVDKCLLGLIIMASGLVAEYKTKE